MEMGLPEGATVAEAALELLRSFPRIGNDPEALVVAVNQEYASHDLPLSEGDEVAFIPPVSGGSNDNHH